MNRHKIRRYLFLGRRREDDRSEQIDILFDLLDEGNYRQVGEAVGMSEQGVHNTIDRYAGRRK